MDDRKILPPPPVYSSKSGRTSVSASVTVEAAFALPLFFLAVISLVFLLEMQAIGTAVRSGLQYAGRKAAAQASLAPVITPAGLEEDVVESVGADRLQRSMVEGGSSGIHCSGSAMSLVTGIARLEAAYQLRLPVPLFRVMIQRKETMRIKAWNGYEKGGFAETEEEIVYVTETGLVYHRDYHCTYLELSIRMVNREDVDGLRNTDGSRYRPCSQCGGGSGAVYITDAGDRYHSSLSCSGLKRTIYAVPLSEVIGKGECSRCGR